MKAKKPKIVRMTKGFGFKASRNFTTYDFVPTILSAEVEVTSEEDLKRANDYLFAMARKLTKRDMKKLAETDPDFAEVMSQVDDSFEKLQKRRERNNAADD